MSSRPQTAALDTTWSATERWIWLQLLSGRIADLNHRYDRAEKSYDPFDDGYLDPSTPEGWGADRRVGVRFLRQILTEPAYAGHLPHGGTKIVGALIDGDDALDLEHATFDSLLWLERCRILVEVNLRDFRCAKELSFWQSYMEKSLELFEARIEGSLDLSVAVLEKGVSASNARIGGDLLLYGSRLGGDADFRWSSVAGHVSAETSFDRYGGDSPDTPTRCPALMFEGSMIEGNLVLSKTRISGGLDLSSATIKKEVSIKQAVIRDVIGNSASLGELRVEQTKVTNTLNLDSAHVDRLFVFSGVEVGSARGNGENVAKPGAINEAMVASKEKVLENSVILSDLTVGLNVFLKNFHQIGPKGEVTFRSAKVEGDIELNGFSIEGGLTVANAIVRRGVKLEPYPLDDGLDVPDMEGLSERFEQALVVGQVTFEHATIDRNVFLWDLKLVKTVLATGLHVGGTLEIAADPAGWDDLWHPGTTGGDLRVEVEPEPGMGEQAQPFVEAAGFDPVEEQAEPCVVIHLRSAKVNGNFELSSDCLTEVDLSGAAIAGAFRLGGEERRLDWEPGAVLDLRNATVGSVDDNGGEDVWPDQLHLEGFTYGWLGGVARDEDEPRGHAVLYPGFASLAPMRSQVRDLEWYRDWLQRDPEFSTQPYEHLAQVLQGSGYARKSEDVLYASRCRSMENGRDDGESWLPFLLGRGLKWTLRLTMGFGLGFRYFRSLWWVIALTLAGAVVLGVTAEAFPIRVASDGGATKAFSYSGLLWASLDNVLPIIVLDEDHAKLTTAPGLPGWAQAFMHAQKLLGWVLGSFLIAGLAGLTQRS